MLLLVQKRLDFPVIWLAGFEKKENHNTNVYFDLYICVHNAYFHK